MADAIEPTLSQLLEAICFIDRQIQFVQVTLETLTEMDDALEDQQLVAETVRHLQHLRYSYGHLSVITGYFSGIIHSINGVFLVLITGISGHNCSNFWIPNMGGISLMIGGRGSHKILLVNVHSSSFCGEFPLTSEYPAW